MEKRLATEGYDSFDDMNLKENLLRGIYEYGYKKPSLIQHNVIVPFSNGDDLVVQEMLGPGRTSTFCIGVLQRLNLRMHECQCIILTISGFQALEIAAAMQKLGKFMDVKVSTHLTLGNRTVDDDLATDPSHVVVGSMNHILELVRRKTLRLQEIKMLVLDEATTMLDIGFRRDAVYEIIKYLNEHKIRVQIGAFSETMSTPTLDRIIERMSKKKKKKPVVIKASKGPSLDGIWKHKVLNVENDDIIVKKLKEIIDNRPKIAPIMVLVSTPGVLNFVRKKLEDDKCIFSVVQGCMDQKKIDEIKEEFLQQKRVILATSLWARGIIEECGDRVRFIVNYNNSPWVEEYLWELGWFRKVVAAISFATSEDWINLVNLQKEFNIVFERSQLSQICDEFWREKTVKVSTRFQLSQICAESWREKTAKVSTIEKTPIKHFTLACVDEKGIISALQHSGQGSLYDKFSIARLSVIFVKHLGLVTYLAALLKSDSKYEVLTPEDSLKVHSTLPTILITTDGMFDDREVKTPLVVNLDVRSALENYDRRRRCCQSNGIFLLFATDDDWYEVFDMQALYNVSFTRIPQDIDDILKKMAGTSISPSTSKGPWTRSQTRKRPRTRSQTRWRLIN